VRRHGPGDTKPLSIDATEFDQRAALFCGFHAFCNHIKIKGSGQSDNALDDRPVAFVVFHVTDE